MKTEQEKYDELALYTLEHGDPVFIHQYIVDAYAAQYADKNTKPIALAFALIGLYLHLDKNYSGRQVQLAHIQMGKKKKVWPKFSLPNARGDVTVEDVLKTKPGVARDAIIDEWSRSVWKAWAESHKQVQELVKSEFGI